MTFTSNGANSSSVAAYPQFTVKVAGRALEADEINTLLFLDVETTISRPDAAMLAFKVTTLDEADALADRFAVGKEVEVSIADASAGSPTQLTLFKGEVTALELDGSMAGTMVLRVRVFDKRHRLYRNEKSATHLDVTVSDLVSRLCRDAGLTVQVTATTIVLPYVFQCQESAGALIDRLLAEIGYVTLWDPVGNRMWVGAASEKTTNVATLKYGEKLLEFRGELTSSGVTSKSTVKGWDPATKAAIVGQASSPSGLKPEVPSTVKTPFGASDVFDNRPVSSQAEAAKRAQAVVDGQNDGAHEVSGAALGDPKLTAGAIVKLEIGTKFSAEFRLSTVRHRLEEGVYRTEFSCHGTDDRTLTGLIHQSADDTGAGAPAGHGFHGVYPAIVTNIDDSNAKAFPKTMQVKVKFPWLDDTLESNWMRVMGAGAGAGRGFQVIPNVNDEVLVAFEQGDFRRGYVLGGVWNGKDAPPVAPTVAAKSGKANQWVIKTTSGHQLVFNDEGGKESISIIDKSGGNSIVIDTAKKSVAVTSDGDVTVDAKGNIKAEAKGNVEVKATGNAKVEATGNVDLKGVNVNVEASAQLKLKGAIVQVEGSGPVTIKGAIINLN